jgi:hypothetical protein
MFAIAAITVAISYITSHKNIAYWVSVRTERPADVEIRVVENMVSGFSGLTYLVDYYCNFAAIMIVVLLACFSLAVGGVTYRNVRFGYGNMIVVRGGYVKYIRDLLLAQFLYITTLFWGFVILLSAGTLMVFPATFSGNFSAASSLGIFEERVSMAFSGWLVQLSIFWLTIVLFILFTALFTYACKNKYIVLCVPLLLLFLPFFLFGILSGFSPVFDTIGHSISAFMAIDIWTSLSQYPRSSYLCMAAFGPILIMGILTCISYRFNRRKYEMDYL